jgi:hypothetical protein
MKIAGLLLLFVLPTAINCNAQTLRYFEFTTQCGHGNWQDTSFIAATSNQTVIDTVLAHLALPLAQRKFISGVIAGGNAGVNHNASHWFKWHFVPGQWNLAEAAMEVCDGCPYTDVDADTAYWISVIGEFCPWSGQPVREVSNPAGIVIPESENAITIYPNPASDHAELISSLPGDMNIDIFNAEGQRVESIVSVPKSVKIDLTVYSPGVYFLRIAQNNTYRFKKLVISDLQLGYR